MATKKDTSNLITQPPSGDSEEDIGIEDKENDQIAPELRQSIEKVQIDPPNNAIEGDITIDEVNIPTNTNNDNNNRITASTTTISEATNCEESKEKDDLQVSKINDDHNSINNHDIKTTLNDVRPIVPLQIQDQSRITVAPATSTTATSKAATAEEIKKKDNVEASQIVNDEDHNNQIDDTEKMDENVPIVVPNIQKQPTLESVLDFFDADVMDTNESKEKDNVEESKIVHDHEHNDGTKKLDENVPIVVPNNQNQQTLESVLNLETEMMDTNDVSNELPKKVDVPVELTKKNDANTIIQKMINERKSIVDEWALSNESENESSTENTDQNASTSNISNRKDTVSTQRSIGKTLPNPPPGCNLVIPPSARIAGGSFSKVYTEDIKKSNQNKKMLQPQRGLSQCSALLCPNLYLYEHYTVDDKLKSYSDENGPFGLCKIIQVPNQKKNVNTYKILYADIHNDKDGWVDEFPKNDFVKKKLQEAVIRANEMNWRFVSKKKGSTISKTNTSKKNQKPKKIPKKNNSDDRFADKSKKGTVLLSGILEEQNQNPTSDDSSSGFIERISERLRKRKESDSSTDSASTTSSSSDEEVDDCDLGKSAYVRDPNSPISFDNIIDGGEEQLHVEESIIQDDEPETKYLGDNWEWNCWEEHDIEKDIPGPKEHDHYNGLHGLRKGVGRRFHTILQCLFETTAMDRSFFLRLCAESNKYARKIMNERNTKLFIGHKWSNISVQEMIHFFGIMLRISLEPRKMGGYDSYFIEDHTIVLANGYTVTLTGYSPWAKDIMTLVRFKQIRSAFRPESENMDRGDKCYQLRWFIRKFNLMARKTFVLGPTASFDEGGIPMRSRFCPVRQYNKDKPAKYRVDFFILADASHYFIYHLDVYQGKNLANIDIDPLVRHLPTTQKAVANAILKSQINNDKDGCRYIMMDNRYAAPQLLAIMLTNYNIRGVGTCKASRTGYDSERLLLEKNQERGSFKRLVDPRLGMVITRWRDSKTLQTVSTVMKHGKSTVQRRVGSKIINVVCPNDIILYQQGMGGVDRGDQHRVVGAGFANVAHFKKWYKKAFFGIADFCLLQAFTAWNLSIDARDRKSSESKRKKIVKWEFYSVMAEEMMNYVDRLADGDNDGTESNNKKIKKFMDGHYPKPYFQFDKKLIVNRPVCMICSMEESVRANVFKLSYNKIRKRTFSRRVKHLGKCMCVDCDIVAHTCQPLEAKVGEIPGFDGLTCFEIAHTPECRGMFTRVPRNGSFYCRTIPSHSIVRRLTDIYEAQQPRRSKRDHTSLPKRQVGRPPSTILTSNTPKKANEESITELSTFETTPETFPRNTRKRKQKTVDLSDKKKNQRVTRSRAKQKIKKSKRLRKQKVCDI